MGTPLIDNLRVVYEHLDRKRQKLKKEYEEVESTLASIQREILVLRTTQAQLFPDDEPRPEKLKYQNISMRWAILWFLSETIGPQQTPTIAFALRNGGFGEKPNFNSIVSAILSQMSQKGEVTRVENGFLLTGGGSNIWENIQRSEKFLNRHSVPQKEEADIEG